jgi:hypothetical protein
MRSGGEVRERTEEVRGRTDIALIPSVINVISVMVVCVTIAL